MLFRIPYIPSAGPSSPHIPTPGILGSNNHNALENQPNVSEADVQNSPRPSNIKSRLPSPVLFAGDVMTWPGLKQMLAHIHTPAQFLQAELERPPLLDNIGERHQKCPEVDVSQQATSKYADIWWDNDYFNLPIFDFDDFQSMKCRVIAQGFAIDLESCCVLLVCAIGCAIMPGVKHEGGKPFTRGIEYYHRALQIFGRLCAFTKCGDILTTQCLCLAARWLSLCGRWLESNRLTILASSSVVVLIQQHQIQKSQPSDLLRRLYWTCYNAESVACNTPGIPKLNLSAFEDIIGLPEGHDPRAIAFAHFLSTIACRRLKNRINASLCAFELSRASVLTLSPLTAELDYQATCWVRNQPDSIRPNLDGEPPECEMKYSTRIVYHGVKNILRRPFLLFILSNDEGINHHPSILQQAQECLKATRDVLYLLGSRLHRPRNHLWSVGQHVCACCYIIVASYMHGIGRMLLPVDAIAQLHVGASFLELWSDSSPAIKFGFERLREVMTISGLHNPVSVQSDHVDSIDAIATTIPPGPPSVARSRRRTVNTQDRKA